MEDEDGKAVGEQTERVLEGVFGKPLQHHFASCF